MKFFARCDFEGLTTRLLCEEQKRVPCRNFKLLRTPPPARPSPRPHFVMLDFLPKLPSPLAEGQVAWMYDQPTNQDLPILQREGTLFDLRRVTFFHGSRFDLLSPEKHHETDPRGHVREAAPRAQASNPPLRDPR